MLNRKITKTMLFCTMIGVFFLGSLNVHAETKTYNKPSGNTINLVDAAKQLNETYTYNDGVYKFSFNGKTLAVKKDSPIITVNDEKQLIETEEVNGIRLPKYTTLTINDQDVEFNYEKFLKITEYSHDNKGIQITVDDAYKIPEQKKVENLNVEYVRTHLTELGYTRLGETTYVYCINNTTYNEVRTSDSSIEIRINIGDEYKNNQSVNNLCVETILKCFDQNNAENLYSTYLDGKDVDTSTDKIQVSMTFTDTLNTVSIKNK